MSPCPRSNAARACAVGLALTLALQAAAPAFADPPPWAPAHGYREKHGGGNDKHGNKHRYVGYRGAQWSEDYGVTEGTCNRAVVATVIGAAVGGVVGSRVGEQNRPIAIAIGAIIGGVIGHEVGQRMDDADRGCIGHALELAHEGKSVRWRNERSGVDYVVTPGGQWKEGGSSCRVYEVRASQGSRFNLSDGRACRTGDGVWQVRS
ncbi:MAG: RT0821/Lpp0805 family surface protein [Gammaproteobacteria bacterium]